MALPKNIRPEYSTTIPSTGKRIKYQPFSVKEEKILILASESQDQDEIANAISNVLERCITSPADFKVSELALFDVEYIFLKTRAKSAGEKIKVNVTDPNDETYTVEHEIDIDKIKVEKTKGHSNIVELTSEISCKMRYPDISFFQDGVDVNNIDSTTSTIAKCISQIIVGTDGEEVYNSNDLNEGEILEWMEGLTTEQFKKMNDFFTTMPKLKHSFTLTNPNTGDDFTIELEGLADFF